MKIGRWLKCNIFRQHEWTCKAKEGFNPTKEEMDKPTGFWEYAEMYCKHCNKKSKLTRNDQLQFGYKEWKINGSKIRW